MSCVRCGFPEQHCSCPPIGRPTASINPWSSEQGGSVVSGRPKWEFVPVEKTAEKHPDVYRLRVPGGWLYRLGLKSTEAVFVPER